MTIGSQLWNARQLVCVVLLLVLPVAVQSQEPPQDELLKAIADLRARRLEPEKIAAAQSSAFQLIAAGHYQAAWSLFEAILENSPRDQRASYGGALALFNLRRIAEARILTTKAVEMASAASAKDRESDALVLLGVILAVDGDNTGALKAVRRAVELTPESFDAQFAFGRALYGAGDVSSARVAFRKAVALRPQEPQPHFFLATTLEAAGEYTQAREAYEQLIKIQPDQAEGHLGLGVLLTKLDSSKHDEAIRELFKAVSIRGDLYEARVALGRALIKSARYAEAIEQLKQAALLAPNNPEPHYQLATAYRRMGNKEAAAVSSARVKEINASRRSGSASSSQKPDSENPN